MSATIIRVDIDIGDGIRTRAVIRQPGAAAYAALCHTDTARLAVWDAYVAAAALHSMADWGLAADVEAHRRRQATQALDEAAATVIGAPRRV